MRRLFSVIGRCNAAMVDLIKSVSRIDLQVKLWIVGAVLFFSLIYSTDNNPPTPATAASPTQQGSASVSNVTAPTASSTSSPTSPTSSQETDRVAGMSQASRAPTIMLRSKGASPNTAAQVASDDNRVRSFSASSQNPSSSDTAEPSPEPLPSETSQRLAVVAPATAADSSVDQRDASVARAIFFCQWINKLPTAPSLPRPDLCNSSDQPSATVAYDQLHSYFRNWRNLDMRAGSAAEQQFADDWAAYTSTQEISNRTDTNGLTDYKCGAAQTLCREGMYLCAQYRDEFRRSGRYCAGVTD
jgi:hypothetical protein